MRAMTLHIRAQGAVQFQARVFNGRQLVAEPTLHDSVEQAIQAYGVPIPDTGKPDDLGELGAYELWYEGATIGRVAPEQMLADAPGLAQRLRVLSAVLR